MQEFLITAVDIGTKNISASIGKYTKGEEVEILGSSCVQSKGVERGILKDKEKCKKQFLTVLRNLEKENNVQINNVYIGLSGDNFKIEEVESFYKVDGIISKRDIVKTINDCKKKLDITKDELITDISINYYIIDNKISHKIPIGLKCEVLGVNITISKMSRDLAKEYKFLCEGTKYYIEEFVVNSISLKNIFVENNLKRSRFIIEVGAGVTEILHFKNRSPVEIIDIPLGGNDITNDISICSEIDFEKAEEIKKRFSSSFMKFEGDKENFDLEGIKLEKGLFFDICIARIEEILNYVKNELKKASHFNETCSIILYGDALTNFQNINDLVKEILGPNISIRKKEDFGMDDFKDIVSLAIVKEVHDKVELLYENSSIIAEEFRKIESNINMTENRVEKKKIEEKKESKISIVEKIKSFLGDIF